MHPALQRSMSETCKLHKNVLGKLEDNTNVVFFMVTSDYIGDFCGAFVFPHL